jgi:hypothetical protein
MSEIGLCEPDAQVSVVLLCLTRLPERPADIRKCTES